METNFQIVVALGVLSIPYAYLLVRIVALAYFQAKLNHHLDVMQTFRKEELHD